MEEKEYTGWYFEFIEEWSQFFSICNWYTFHPFNLTIEDDRIMGGVEVTLILLGIGFRLRWNYTKTKKVSDIIEQLKEIKRELGKE